ncbi:MAG: CBS domain-containing protein [Candidatus Omnitrophota bacterium]
MKAKDIMIKNVKTISSEMNAREALNLLQKLQISGLPVIDDKKKLIGMFTEKEILASILPSYLSRVGRFVYEENSKAVKQKINNFPSLKVKDLMRLDVVTIDEDATLCEVAHAMLTQRVRRTPILNKNREVVGIISRGDVMNALFQGL